MKYNVLMLFAEKIQMPAALEMIYAPVMSVTCDIKCSNVLRRAMALSSPTGSSQKHTSGSEEVFRRIGVTPKRATACHPAVFRHSPETTPRWKLRERGRDTCGKEPQQVLSRTLWKVTQL